LRLSFPSKDKNDKDAERLAKLLYQGEAPAVHVPSADVRTWRELITSRVRAALSGRSPTTDAIAWHRACFEHMGRREFPKVFSQQRTPLAGGNMAAPFSS
jgi:hypothetical protein